MLAVACGNTLVRPGIYGKIFYFYFYGCKVDNAKFSWGVKSVIGYSTSCSLGTTEDADYSLWRGKDWLGAKWTEIEEIMRGVKHNGLHQVFRVYIVSAKLEEAIRSRKRWHLLLNIIMCGLSFVTFVKIWKILQCDPGLAHCDRNIHNTTSLRH